MFHGNRINFHVVDRENDPLNEWKITMLSRSSKFSKIGFTISHEDELDEDDGGGIFTRRRVIHEWVKDVRREGHWTDIRIEARDQPVPTSSSTCNGETQSSPESCEDC